MVKGQNQPKIAPKRIKLEEIVEKVEMDRISALQDCLLLEMLSRLPSTKDAIRTGTLSKRWKHLWASVPTLIFRCLDRKHPLSHFISFVDKTLTQCRPLKLKKFEVFTIYDFRFKLQVNNWICYAISRNVEELILGLGFMGAEAEFQLNQLFYITSCFTDLTLKGCMFNPTGAISWKNLRSLSISEGKLDEDLIENILLGSPVLETLVLNVCYGFKRLDITSKSVKNFVFSGYDVPVDEFEADIIEINVTVDYMVLFQAHGYENSPHMEII